MADLLEFLTKFWADLTPDMKTTAVGVLATVFSTTVGALLVIWQIGRQARQAIKQNRDNASLKLKMQLYEEFSKYCGEASSAAVDFSSYIRGFSTDIGLHKSMKEGGFSWRVPTARTTKLLELKSALDSTSIRLMLFAERWQIIEPRTSIFRTAISVALHDLNRTYLPYVRLAAAWMPREDHWQPPNDQVTDEIIRASNAAIDATMELEAFVSDMQTEMQNLLLGELFRHRVEQRAPLDPKRVVLRLEDYNRLKRFFDNATDWGRQKRETEAIVRAQAFAQSDAQASNEPLTAIPSTPMTERR